MTENIWQNTLVGRTSRKRVKGLGRLQRRWTGI